MAKVKPLHDILRKKLKIFDVVHENISIEELMVPYIGRHLCKQFIKAKQICFSFKFWMLARSTGMPYRTHIYEGIAVDKNEDTLRKCIAKRVLQVCITPSNHQVFFNNVSRSYKLLVELDKVEIWATGILQNDRIADCPLTPINRMKKSEREREQLLSIVSQKVNVV